MIGASVSATPSVIFGSSHRIQRKDCLEISLIDAKEQGMKALSLASAIIIASNLTAADLKPTREGVSISAGTLGSFTLSYPEFIDQANATVHKVVEVQTTGTSADIRYADGAQCKLSISGGEITTTFSALPADVKSWKVSMLLDIGFAKGGTWAAGAQSGTFPAQKANPPQIASLSATSFSIKNAQGQSLALTTPDYAFQQLTDNRQWDWAVFHWQCIVPWSADRPTAKFRLSSDLQSSVKLVDSFGQSIAAKFPDKLASLDELKSDVAADAAYYASIQTPETDRFGGHPGSGTLLGLRKTGFFHIEQKQDKTWLVDPEGNVFFDLGVCGFAPNDDYTYVKGRESIYEWLPKAEGEFASAFRPGDGDANFSFHLANTIRKFGKPYDQDSFTERMIQRVRKWGFNSIGAFTPTPPSAHVKASFPYVAHLPINQWEGVPRLPGAHEVWDPYDPATEKKLAENIAREVPARASDPLLIGWFIVNEPRYDELPKVIPSLDGQHACKRELVSHLQQRYSDITTFNKAWASTASSFDSLVPTGLAVTTDAAIADVQTFIAAFLETYFAQVEKHFRLADPHHLLIGSRLQPITIKDETLCRIMGQHVDVVSYNYYTYGVDAAELQQIHRWTGGKPMMLSEFFWASSSDSGLIGGREVSSQQERGLAYRNYVEQSAALGFVIGIEWFTLVDQATTGRWFSQYNGESYNTGLISVADRPWKPMLVEMMKTNHTIYDLLLGKREPFKWDDPRFKVPK